MPNPVTFLSDEERGYYDTLKIKKRKDDFALGRFTLKTLLAENFVAVPLDEIEILRDHTAVPLLKVQGKPEKTIKISLSHSNGYCAAAASEEVKMLGIDLEKTEKRSPLWAEQFFYKTEYTPASTDEELTALWTKKEAALKMLGLGLSVNTYDIRFEKGKIYVYGNLKEFESIMNEVKIDTDTQSLAGFVLTAAYL
ncbi:4'-phosphopantetheinyl transferase [Parelusimicrobium proximum]